MLLQEQILWFKANITGPDKAVCYNKKMDAKLSVITTKMDAKLSVTTKNNDAERTARNRDT